MATKKKEPQYKIDKARGILTYLFGLSGLINILALTGAFYMLQIYDRALASGSISTLIALSVLAIGLYLFQGVFDTAALGPQRLIETRALLPERFVGVEPLFGEVDGDLAKAFRDVRQPFDDFRVRLFGRRRDARRIPADFPGRVLERRRDVLKCGGRFRIL